MTKEELIQDGWEPRLCMIDTLYFKGQYLIRLLDGKAKVYSVYDDNKKPLGEAEKIEDIFSIQKEHQRDTIKRKEKEIELLKNLFEAIYGEKI